jgi:hypothetical protein
MNVLSCNIYDSKGSTWIELERGGPMTVETYTESNILSSEGSRLNVKTTKRWTYRAGLRSWIVRSLLTVVASALSSTRNEEKLVVKTSTQPSHSGCCCNSSPKPDTVNA